MAQGFEPARAVLASPSEFTRQIPEFPEKVADEGREVVFFTVKGIIPELGLSEWSLARLEGEKLFLLRKDRTDSD